MGAPPFATSLGDLLTERLSPLMVGETDPDRALSALAHALLWPLEEAYDVAQDRDDATEGWVVALDPDRAPEGSLPWLAQWTGAPTVGVTRQQIKDHLVLRRGRPASITTAVAATLTGGRVVLLTERHQGSAWRLLVQVFARDCPDPGAAELAGRGQTPVGVRLTFEMLSGKTVGMAESAVVTVGDAEATWPTVAAAEA